MNTDRAFIFNQKTKDLFDPDGGFLKRIFCPYKELGRSLAIDFEAQKESGICEYCNDVVLNIDEMPVNEVVDFLRRQPSACVHATASSGKVIFLERVSREFDEYDVEVDATGLPHIRTARTLEDINRAAADGHWPDVRLVIFDTETIQSKFSVGQNQITGAIDVTGDYRESFPGSSSDFASSQHAAQSDWREVIPFTSFYSNYQNLPLAAYLIPKDLPDGSKVIVDDPIEDLPGSRWNQGDVRRAEKVPGIVKDRKVILQPEEVQVRRFVG